MLHRTRSREPFVKAAGQSTSRRTAPGTWLYRLGAQANAFCLTGHLVGPKGLSLHVHESAILGRSSIRSADRYFAEHVANLFPKADRRSNYSPRHSRGGPHPNRRKRNQARVPGKCTRLPVPRERMTSVYRHVAQGTTERSRYPQRRAGILQAPRPEGGERPNSLRDHNDVLHDYIYAATISPVQATA